MPSGTPVLKRAWDFRSSSRDHSGTVFVPDGKLDHFEELIVAYLERRKDSLDRPLWPAPFGQKTACGTRPSDGQRDEIGFE